MQNQKLRRVNIWQDLVPVADLIESCFFDTLDDDGRRYVDTMRYLGKNRFAHENILSIRGNKEIFDGFVWQEDGKIVGNITITRMLRNAKTVHVISNVAVADIWRGRGIAGNLTNAALDLAKQEEAAEVWLQVRTDNKIAQHLYRARGFVHKVTRSTWKYEKQSNFLKKQANIKAEYVMRGIKQPDWEQVISTLNNNYNEFVDWFFRFDPEAHKPSLKNTLREFLMGTPCCRVGIFHHNALMACLFFSSAKIYSENTWIGTHNDCEGDDLIALLENILSTPYCPGRIQFNLPAEKFKKPLLESGFQEIHQLIWMSKDLLGSFQ